MSIKRAESIDAGGGVDPNRYTEIHRQHLESAIRAVVGPMEKEGGGFIDVTTFAASVLAGVAIWMAARMPLQDDMTEQDRAEAGVGTTGTMALDIVNDIFTGRHPMSAEVLALATAEEH